MIRIEKVSSLTQAEVLYILLNAIIGDGTDPRWAGMDKYFQTDATTVGERTVYRVINDRNERVVWFGENQVTDGIDIILAVKDQWAYVEKRGRIPTADALVFGFRFDQHYAAANAVFEFLMHGTHPVMVDSMPSSDTAKEDLVAVPAVVVNSILRALNGPGHFIRELQATRTIDGLLGDDQPRNPINVLVEVWNAHVKKKVGG